ncbi:hypothetical protein Taro_047320, partial [Colocasia esculenta]|nr:hypothetical protein [Colocasia esculenta]
MKLWLAKYRGMPAGIMLNEHLEVKLILMKLNVDGAFKRSTGVDERVGAVKCNWKSYYQDYTLSQFGNR